MQGKLITATKYPTMACHLCHTIWPKHKHQACFIITMSTNYWHIHPMPRELSYIQATIMVTKRMCTIKYTKPI